MAQSKQFLAKTNAGGRGVGARRQVNRVFLLLFEKTKQNRGHNSKYFFLRGYVHCDTECPIVVQNQSKKLGRPLLSWERGLSQVQHIPFVGKYGDGNFGRYRQIGKMGTKPKMRTKPYLQNHVVYQITKMILRNPLASPVRGARQNGHAPSESRAFGWAQKAIYASEKYSVPPLHSRFIA